jgi:hypothetical protein
MATTLVPLGNAFNLPKKIREISFLLTVVMFEGFTTTTCAALKLVENKSVANTDNQ